MTSNAIISLSRYDFTRAENINIIVESTLFSGSTDEYGPTQNRCSLSEVVHAKWQHWTMATSGHFKFIKNVYDVGHGLNYM